MIAFQEAYKIVMSVPAFSEAENVPLQHVAGRVLAADIFSDMDMPPFNKSAVDGYACRKADLSVPLKVLEIVPAGKVPQKTITPETCTKVMTGAMIPEGADTVIMVEDTETVAANTVRFLGVKTNANICTKGEDIHASDKVLGKGTIVRAQEIAVLASVGATNPLVSRQPVVAIISTGDELVEPDQNPEPSQIRNSNAAQIMAQAEACNALPVYFGIAKDTAASTCKIISLALDKADLVLLTGGVSMGDFDYVPKVFDELDIQTQFKSIAVQPGRPTVFGTRCGKYLFGLPGNPVSSFVQFELLVKPLIYHLMGAALARYELLLPMGKTYTRNKAKRKSFLPVNIREGKIYPVEYHGSAHIHSYIFADGIVSIEIGNTTLNEGDMVNVRQI